MAVLAIVTMASIITLIAVDYETVEKEAAGLKKRFNEIVR